MDRTITRFHSDIIIHCGRRGWIWLHRKALEHGWRTRWTGNGRICMRDLRPARRIGNSAYFKEYRAMANTKKYMQGLIDLNPTDKLLPMTHRNNHGITLTAWQELFAENNIKTKIEQYMHKIYSANGLKHEARQQLMLA